MGKKKFDDYSENQSLGPIFILIFCSFFLVVINIINVYSAGFSIAESLGKPYTSNLFSQMIYAGMGLVLFIVVQRIKLDVVRYSSPVFMLLVILCLAGGIILDSQFSKTQWFVSLVYAFSIIYWCVFFSNRNNEIESIKEMIVPAVFSIAIMFLLFVNSGIGYAFCYLVITVIVFSFCGVGFFSILLTVLYSLIPCSVFFLTGKNRVEAVLGFLVPGLFEEATDSLSFLSKCAVSSGELLGKGLGMGDYKYLLGNRILSDYAFCSFAEEMGFLGVGVLVVLILVLIISSFIRAKEIKEERLFESDLTYSFCAILFCQIICNFALVLGILPFEGITFPFLAQGPELIVLMLELSFITRSASNSFDIKNTPGDINETFIE